MHIAILGTGALACVFAAHLAPHVDVTMLGTWPEGLAALALHGVRLVDPRGREVRRPVVVAGSPAGVPPADIVLVLVKSYQTERAAEWAGALLAPDGIVLTLQNGLDNGERLGAVAGMARVAVGATYQGATLVGPGEVRHTANQPTYMGPLIQSVLPAMRAQLNTFISHLNLAGLEAHAEDNVEGRLWGKAIANAAINPLTALWRVPNGALLATPARQRLLHCLAGEAAAVAAARGTVLPFADALAQVDAVCRATAENRSSMLQDVERGRQTEIDGISGIIVGEGARLNVPTPYNELMWQLVRAL